MSRPVPGPALAAPGPAWLDLISVSQSVVSSCGYVAQAALAAYMLLAPTILTEQSSIKEITDVSSGVTRVT